MIAINIISLALAALGSLLPLAASAQVVKGNDRPTIVLVHGAFAESGSWNDVIERLHADGYNVIAASNPLRSVKTDAASVASVLKSVKEPVVLVGHSYGGTVITDAAAGQDNVKALVYVAGFAPDAGETSAELTAQFPGATLANALTPPVDISDGNKDLYIQQAKFAHQFAADVPAKQALLMAVTQRPITVAALNEATVSPTWKQKPSYFIYGSADLNIPPAVQDFMAKRANSKNTVVVPDASHVVMTSHPDAVAKLIEEAARAK